MEVHASAEQVVDADVDRDERHVTAVVGQERDRGIDLRSSGDATFHFAIEGDTISFEPVLPDRCAGFDCVWMIAVASPGYSWERVA